MTWFTGWSVDQATPVLTACGILEILHWRADLHRWHARPLPMAGRAIDAPDCGGA